MVAPTFLAGFPSRTDIEENRDFPKAGGLTGHFSAMAASSTEAEVFCGRPLGRRQVATGVATRYDSSCLARALLLLPQS